MQLKPSQAEISDLQHLGQEERFRYFLSRTIESEEVWSLGDSSGWLIRESEGKSILPIWPYRELALLHIEPNSDGPSAIATSLDHFVHHLLHAMTERSIDLEVLPTATLPGRITTAQELYSIFEGMLDAGEYYLEG